MSLTDPQAAVAADLSTLPRRHDRSIRAERTAARRARLLRSLIEAPAGADDLPTLDDQVSQICPAFRPRGAWQDWLTAQVATIMLGLDRSERVERRLREHASYRAIDFWEEDQGLAAEALAARLPRDPARVVARLRQSLAGCDWLLNRWRALGRVEPLAWSDEQRQLATQLVGDADPIDPTSPGFIAAQVAELAGHRERITEADAILRGLVEADLSDAGVPGLAALRRYTRALQRQLTWTIEQFHAASLTQGYEPDRRPDSGQVTAAPVGETKPFEPTRLADQTKPLGVAAWQRTDETKPFGSLEEPAGPYATVPQVFTSRVFVIQEADITPRSGSPRSSSVAEVAGSKQARRQASLAGAPGS